MMMVVMMMMMMLMLMLVLLVLLVVVVVMVMMMEYWGNVTQKPWQTGGYTPKIQLTPPPLWAPSWSSLPISAAQAFSHCQVVEWMHAAGQATPCNLHPSPPIGKSNFNSSVSAAILQIHHSNLPGDSRQFGNTLVDNLCNSHSISQRRDPGSNYWHTVKACKLQSEEFWPSVHLRWSRAWRLQIPQGDGPKEEDI